MAWGAFDVSPDYPISARPFQPQMPNSDEITCPKEGCGTVCSASANFCSKCGQDLKPAKDQPAACTTGAQCLCGTIRNPQDPYCCSCGRPGIRF